MERCRVVIDQNNLTPCNESATLSETLNQINSIYFQRIEYNFSNSSNCMHIYSQWCEELLHQVQELINCIEQLEIKATNRLIQFNEKHFGGNRIKQLNNDVENVIELIKRKKLTNIWNTNGLLFYDERIANSFSENLATSPNVDFNVEINTLPYNGHHHANGNFMK